MSAVPIPMGGQPPAGSQPICGSVFPWFGGKARLARTIIDRFPPHSVYVEPFGGAANVLLRKPPSPIEVYNDMSDHLVHFFRVLQCQEQRAALLDRLAWTPYARAEYARAMTCNPDYLAARQPANVSNLWFEICMARFDLQDIAI